jgi:nucleoid-associated protein YgaU
MRSISPYEQYGVFTPDEDATLEEYVWTVSDTITGLARRKYGDWQLWRIIAERNKIDDVRQIKPGTILLIPQKPLKTGVYETL